MDKFGIEWHLERRFVSELRDYELNPRRINKEMYAKLRENIEKFGVIDRPCINLDGVLIGGHQRTRLFREMGIAELDVWVPNRMLSGDEIKKLNVILNKVGGEFDYDVLAGCFDVDDLLDLGFNENELLGFDAIGEVCGEPECGDEPVTPNDNPRSRVGDVFDLGGHRLICGDCTDGDVVARLLNGEKPLLMVTDPPYGVNYDPKWRGDVIKDGANRKTGAVSNDHKADWADAYALFPGDIAYVWHASWFTYEVIDEIKKCGFDLISLIVWAKQHFALSRGDYHWKHELCWYTVRHGAKHRWRGGRKQSTVWEIANFNSFGSSDEDMRTNHSTQKPLECMSRPICNHLKKNEIVYDPFLGSGTTLIAADMNGRRCYGIEIDPGYCDIIVDRYVSHCLRNGLSGEVKLNGEKTDWRTPAGGTA